MHPLQSFFAAYILHMTKLYVRLISNNPTVFRENNTRQFLCDFSALLFMFDIMFLMLHNIAVPSIHVQNVNN